MGGGEVRVAQQAAVFLRLPQDVIEKTAAKYREALERLMG